MKFSHVFLVTAIYLLSMIKVSSQDSFFITDSWNYGYYDFSTMSYSGDLVYRIIGDTVINDLECKIILRDTLDCDVNPVRFYVYETADKVLLYNFQNDEFITIYDFTLEAGDVYYLPPLVSTDEDSLGVKIHSVELYECLGRQFEVQLISTDDFFDGFPEYNTHFIIKGVGTTKDDLFFYGGEFGDGCNEVITGLGSFMVNDSEQTLIGIGCFDFIISEVNNEESNSCSIYPNPAIGSIYFNCEVGDRFNYKIYSFSGEIMFSGRCFEKTRIDVSHLNRGGYIIEFYDNEMNRSIVKFVKM